MRRAEVVRGLEPISAIDVDQARRIHEHFEEVCGVPAIWQRTFDDLLGCFKTPESAIKAFRVLDTDGNGLVDAREMLGALAIMSRGHLSERMALLFDVFDLNMEKQMTFDECFLMIRRTLAGLRKMVGIHSPPEKVVHNMARQVWRQAQKHRDVRISHSDWYAWWCMDASCRNGLKIFIWKPEDVRGLPTPDQYVHIDYAKGVSDDAELTHRGSTLSQSPSGSRPSTPPKGGRPSPGVQNLAKEFGAAPRRASFMANADADGNVSRPVFEDFEDPISKRGGRSSMTNLEVPGVR